MNSLLAFSAGLLAGLALAFIPARTAAQTTAPSAEVESGNFSGLTPAQAKELRRRIESTVREIGVLESADAVEIRSPVDGERAILRLSSDGTAVKKGDLVVELDSAGLRDSLAAQQAAIVEAQAGLRQAETALADAEQIRTHGVAVAEMAVKVAGLDRARYLAEGGEFELAKKKADRDVALAEQRLKVAQAAQRPSADEATLAVAEAQAGVAAAQAARQLLTGALHEYRTAALELAVLQAKGALAQAQSQSRLAREKAAADVAAKKAALDLEVSKLAAVQRQIESCAVRAPRDGLVLVAQGPLRGAGAVEEGALVRGRQLILTVADMSRLRVRVKVNESRIDRVRKGQPARFRLDALPDRTFRGTVVHVADAPEPATWFRGDVKEYSVLMALEETSPGMKLGMTGEAEIDVSQPGREQR